MSEKHGEPRPQSSVSEDAETEEPATDTPTEFKRFEDLARRLMRVPKSAVNGKQRANGRSAARK